AGAGSGAGAGSFAVGRGAFGAAGRTGRASERGASPASSGKAAVGCASAGATETRYTSALAPSRLRNMRGTVAARPPPHNLWWRSPRDLERISKMRCAQKHQGTVEQISGKYG